MLDVESLYYIDIFTAVSIARPLFGWSYLIAGALVNIDSPISTPRELSKRAGGRKGSSQEKENAIPNLF